MRNSKYMRGSNGAVGAAQQPALPVGILLADGSDVSVLRHVPARAVEVPALADGDDLAQLAALRIISRTRC